MIIYPPIKADKESRSLFIDPPRIEKTQLFIAEAQPSNIGFGYINNPLQQSVEVPLTPTTPLKSAFKVPWTLGRKISNPLRRTFREEQILEKYKEMTKKEQARDLVHNKIHYKMQHN
jgi:hypothetical protein